MSTATATSAASGNSNGPSAAASSSNANENITLSLTHEDVKRVLEASEALTKELHEIQEKEEQQSFKEEVESPVRRSTRKHQASEAAAAAKSETSSGDSSDKSSTTTTTTSSDEKDEDDASGDPPLRTVSCDDDAKEGEGTSTTTSICRKRPLHDLVYEAAQKCNNSMLQSFLERMKNSGSTSKEIRAGVMVFSDLDLTSKVQHIFDVLDDDATTATTPKKDDDKDRSLSREGALSLFRAVIIAISSCIHKNARLQTDSSKEDTNSQPPQKRRKLNTTEAVEDKKDDASSSQAPENDAASRTDSVPSLSTPTASFDSTVDSLKEEKHEVSSKVQKQFQGIAMFARDRLVRYTQKKTGNKNLDTVVVTFSIFQDWRKAEGARIAPWLDLLDLARWKSPARPGGNSSQQQQAKQKQQQPPPTQAPAPTTSEQVEKEPQQEQKQAPAATTPEKVEPTSVEEDEKKSPTVKESSPSSKSTSKENEAPPVDPTAATTAPGSTTKPRTPTPPTSNMQPAAGSQTPLYVADAPSRTILSFDFSASLPGAKEIGGFVITISEENLRTFRSLVRVSGLFSRSCQEVASILWDSSKTRSFEGKDIKVVPIERFHTCLHQLLGSGSSQRLSKNDNDVFSSCLVDFFNCFNTDIAPLEKSEALASELVIGFCFMCAGNKSQKLSTGFDLLEHEKGRGLSNEQLVHFLRSYLTMLAGISVLTSATDGIMKPKMGSETKKTMYQAVENGAKWTVSHFLKAHSIEESDTKARHTFESFASWYSSGGYNVAPWLELLDLNKLLCLVPDEEMMMMKSPHVAHDSLPMFPGPKTSSPEYALSPHPPLRRPPPSHHRAPRTAPAHHPAPTTSPLPTYPSPQSSQVLFTFPLANQCSLVVLKEDATYVRSVVEQLGLLLPQPDEVWSSLVGCASKRAPLPATKGHKKQTKADQSQKTMLVNKEGFVESMQQTMRAKGSLSKKRSSAGMSKSESSSHDLLANFFQSFDLLQSDRVPLNELMGGLTLLCGGKKSTKLSFAFSVFDRRHGSKKKSKKSQQSPNSLDGEELFLFLRSFLIVMFSCCRQSWDLTDDMVNRYIADTANMVAEDVVRYQWRTRKKDRVDFDEFGQWYNEGGFERAPWLELLDLKKWVLVDSFDEMTKQRSAPPPPSPSLGLLMADADCPPPPPDAEVDPSFFEEDVGGIMQMDSMDEMDLLLISQPSHDKDDIFSKSFPFSPKPSPKEPPRPSSNAIKFHILTKDNHDGYVVSVSQKRIGHLRHVLFESGLHEIDGEHACREILGNAQRDGKSPSGSTNYVLTKADFDSAVVRIVTSRNMSVQTQTTLTAILREIFSAFDRDGTGKASAFDIACGFAVLCRGKKSDKLEYAFEILDRDKQGFLTRSDTIRYLRSFLVVLLTIVTTNTIEADFLEDSMTTMSGEKCDTSMSSINRAIESGCSWAADQAMKGSNDENALSFDDFAAWYTRIGYGNIPWLELLDLNKWVLNASGETTPAH